MTEYLNFWVNYFNFTDRTTRKGYWMMVLVNAIIIFVLNFFPILPTIYSLATFIPGIAIIVRRFRDAGLGWGHIFWFIGASIFLGLGGLIGALIALVCAIIPIVLLCQPSAPDNGIPIV